MAYSKIITSVKDKIFTIALNSPNNLNSFDETMLDEIVDALKSAEKDNDVKVVVLTSTSKAFSAGGDIGAMYKGIKTGTLDLNDSIKKMATVPYTMKKISKPVISAVEGAVAGAGFNVALASDLVVAADNAVFLQAFVNIGLIPDAGGLYLLTRSLGVNKAMELSMTGRTVKAEEAFSLGFVTQIVKPEELETAAYKLAGKLASGPSTSYAEMKRLMFESEFKDFERYVEEEVKSQVICGDTADFAEGVSAFVEKRKANFK